jgi:hypothetical protein
MQNKQSFFVFILISLIALVLAVGGGVYLYQENKKSEIIVPIVETDTQTTIENQQTVIPNTNKNVTNTAVSSNSAKDLSNWKIYKNSKFNMQISYPPTLDLQESEVDCSSNTLEEECLVYLFSRSEEGLVRNHMSFILHHYDSNNISNYSNSSEVGMSGIDKFIYGIHAWTIYKDNLPPLNPAILGKFNVYTSVYDNNNVMVEFIYVKRDDLVIQFIYDQKSKIHSENIADLVKNMILTLK